MRVELALDPVGSDELLRIPSGYFLDLRDDPSAIDRIAHARLYPRLRGVLAVVNSPDSVFSSVSSSAGPSPQDHAGTAPYGFSSSFSLIFNHEDSRFDQRLVADTARQLANLLGSDASDSFLCASIRLSPCLIGASGLRGHALLVSVSAQGATPELAEMRWGLALTRLQQALLYLSRVIRRNRSDSA